MRIDRAIKILSDEPETIDYENDPEALAALKLGIEALKLVKDQCGHRWTDAPQPLPGETEE